MVEDDDGGVLTRRSAPVSRQRRDERRGGDRRPSDVDHHDDKPLSPAISALLKLHAKKHYEEVEAILTTMSPQDRHRFKSEVICVFIFFNGLFHCFVLFDRFEGEKNKKIIMMVIVLTKAVEKNKINPISFEKNRFFVF